MQGTVTGKKPRILIFDDVVKDTLYGEPALAEYLRFFAAKGYDAIGVQVVPDNDKLSPGQLLQPPKEGVTRGVYTPDDVKALLTELQPNAVLTDGHWRNTEIFSSTPTKGGIGGGVALYDLVREHDRNIPCVLHTSGRVHTGVVTEQMADHAYMVASKHDGGLEKIAEYFETKIAQGRKVE